MTPLTENFSLEEFQKDAPIPPELIPVFKSLCVDLLEPIRAHFGVPIVVTSGYRDAASNATAHGVPNSEHVASLERCAADFYMGEAVSMRGVFDWIRNNPKLAWGQAILEHGAHFDILHISWELSQPRRQAFEGAVENKSAYVAWDVAPYVAA